MGLGGAPDEALELLPELAAMGDMQPIPDWRAGRGAAALRRATGARRDRYRLEYFGLVTPLVEIMAPHAAHALSVSFSMQQLGLVQRVEKLWDACCQGVSEEPAQTELRLGVAAHLLGTRTRVLGIVLCAPFIASKEDNSTLH